MAETTRIASRLQEQLQHLTSANLQTPDTQLSAGASTPERMPKALAPSAGASAPADVACGLAPSWSPWSGDGPRSPRGVGGVPPALVGGRGGRLGGGGALRARAPHVTVGGNAAVQTSQSARARSAPKLRAEDGARHRELARLRYMMSKPPSREASAASLAREKQLEKAGPGAPAVSSVAAVATGAAEGAVKVERQTSDGSSKGSASGRNGSLSAGASKLRATAAVTAGGGTLAGGRSKPLVGRAWAAKGGAAHGRGAGRAGAAGALSANGSLAKGTAAAKAPSAAGGNSAAASKAAAAAASLAAGGLLNKSAAGSSAGSGAAGETASEDSALLNVSGEWSEAAAALRADKTEDGVIDDEVSELLGASEPAATPADGEATQAAEVAELLGEE